jgi:hypothetical protein
VPRSALHEPAVRVLRLELKERAGVLRQQSRFLRRQSARLQVRSNDLLTICLFRREALRPGPSIARAPLGLLS